MDDPETQVIALYMEGLEEPRKLLEAAGHNPGKKPIIAYKGGRCRIADRVSASHTGSMAGESDIYRDVLKQAGILCVESVETLMDLARALSASPLPEGNRVAVLSAQAGPGMIACDMCEMEGLELTTFSRQTRERINEQLPPIVYRDNPVDMGPVFSDSAAVAKIIKTVLKDENVDGIILIILYASANRETIEGIRDLLLEWKQRKPVITNLMAPSGLWDKGIMELERAKALVNFPDPERAARTLSCLWQYNRINKKK
jgi:acyl-CoA synthetase (NDP forming)